MQRIDQADVLILASPVYVYHATGSMKAFLDHFAYRWLLHRPEPGMFRKQGIVLSTAAGAGMKSTNKDMADSLFWWGVGKIYRYGVAVRAVSWEGVSPVRREKIDTSLTKIASQVKRRAGRVKPSLKTRLLFNVFSFVQRKKGISPTDQAYWQAQGWTRGVKPWK